MTQWHSSSSAQSIRPRVHFTSGQLITGSRVDASLSLKQTKSASQF
ncbi:MAG: hypothetical protein LLG42_07430 [Chloroflexi bacterium]|nr:hypothetical protein [Chloroflexota bacterium]